MTKRTYLLLIFWGFCAMWEKAGAWITLGKPELTGPLKSLSGSIEEFYCKLDNIQTNETILYQLFNERNLIKAMGDYSSHSKEKAKFPTIVSLAYDGRLMCKASVQNNSDIIPTLSNWREFHVLVPVEGANIISTPSSGDLWERDSLTLRCSLTKGTYVLYEWFLNDGLLNYNSNELHISSLSSKDSGKYVCVAKNDFNETDYFNSTSEGRNVHVKEYLLKPEISFEVIKRAEGNFSAYVKCQVTKGSPPITFTFFRNNQNVTAVISEHQYSSFTVPIALDQDMGTVYCQANNGKSQLQSRELNLTVVLNKIPVEVAAIVFTSFSLLICAVLACCIYGAVLRKKQARIYMYRLKDFTAMHSIVDDDDSDDDDDNDDDKDEKTEEIEENKYEEEHDDLDTEAYIEDLEVVQASMMKDSDESEEEEKEEENNYNTVSE